MPSYGKEVPGVKDPRFLGAIKLLERTGIKEFQMRYDEEQSPIVWVAVAGYTVRNGKLTRSGKPNAFKAGCGAAPLEAVLDLCYKALEGAVCSHCGRLAGFDESFGAKPLNELFCWYEWDPELEVFRRDCEGD